MSEDSDIYIVASDCGRYHMLSANHADVVMQPQSTVKLAVQLDSPEEAEQVETAAHEILGSPMTGKWHCATEESALSAIFQAARAFRELDDAAVPSRG